MNLKDRRVLVVGLGKSGLAAAHFLRRKGAHVTVSDKRSAEALAVQLPTWADDGIVLQSGGHDGATFVKQDLIVVSPGVPMDTPELMHAVEAGVPVIGELELASHFIHGKILAITGANGKTTTTALVGEILKAAEIPTLVGGNIGVPLIALVGDSTDQTWSVLEVSSFQLESTVDFHPQIAVILNITPDHLDRHGTFENYALTKELIFRQQGRGDSLVLNADNTRTADAAQRATADIYWFSAQHAVDRGAWVARGDVLFCSGPDQPAETIMDAGAIPIKGQHNVENVLAAVCAARLVGVSADVICKAVTAFKAVEHRLEYVATVGGVAFYNDSKATNVDATAKAIGAFDSGVHLILGGKDKNSNYAELTSLLQERVRAVYTIGAAAAKIESQLAGIVPMHSCGTLASAVQAAMAQAKSGDVIVLAPACSSFDQFDSYEHRGRVFKELVHQIADRKACQNV